MVEFDGIYTTSNECDTRLTENLGTVFGIVRTGK